MKQCPEGKICIAENVYCRDGMCAEYYQTKNDIGFRMLDPTTHMWYKPNLNDDEKGIKCPRCYSRLGAYGKCYNCERQENERIKRENERIEHQMRIRQIEWELAAGKKRIHEDLERIRNQQITCSISRTPTCTVSRTSRYEEKILGPGKPLFKNPTDPSVFTQLVMNCKTADIVAIINILERNSVIVHTHPASTVIEAFNLIVKYTPQHRIDALKHITDKYYVYRSTYTKESFVDPITDTPVPKKSTIKKIIDFLTYIFYL